MNSNDPTSAMPPDQPRPIAFCQHCGRPLDQATVRIVGPAVYCEPCLAGRLGEIPGTATNPGQPVSGQPGQPVSSQPASGQPWTTHAAVDPSARNAWQWAAGTPSGWPPANGPNPGLAALLGFIPGVGAMYNEQYAKGVVHLLIFAVLVSLSHSIGIFSLFAFAWVCYMVVEAHHTARARRDGTPLPNPFGLNELSERLGFGRAWPSPRPPSSFNSTGFSPTGSTAASTAPAGEASPAADWTSASTTYPPPPGAAFVPPATPWGAPADAYTAAYPTQAYPPRPYPTPNYQSAYLPPVPPPPPYGEPFPPYPSSDPAFAVPPNRFPGGAIALIALGSIFLLSTTGIFHGVFGWMLVGFVLIGLAVWIFLRRMLDTGPTLQDDGSAGYSLRVLRALRPAVWVLLVGILLLLNEFNILLWRRSWPLFIILAGVMALLQRTVFAATPPAPLPFTPTSPFPASGAQPAWTSPIPSPGSSPAPSADSAAEAASTSPEGGN